MIQWFTLEYNTLRRGHIKLVNLQDSGCDDVEHAQCGLNSTNFKRTPQSHHYSQWEVELIRAKETDAREYGASAAIAPAPTPG